MYVVKPNFSKIPSFKNGFHAESGFPVLSEGLAQEIRDVHMLRGPHGHPEQVHWSFGKADLA